MATPAERAEGKHRHKHGRHHHVDPAKVAEDRRAAARRTGISVYGGGMGAYAGVLGAVTSTGLSQSGHLNPDQFVGYAGGYSTNAGNLTGVAAIEGAAGNGGAGGSGDASGGDSGGAAS